MDYYISHLVETKGHYELELEGILGNDLSNYKGQYSKRSPQKHICSTKKNFIRNFNENVQFMYFEFYFELIRHGIQKVN